MLKESTPTLWDVTELAVVRARGTSPKGQLHKLARMALNDFVNVEYEGPVCLEDLFPWKD